MDRMCHVNVGSKQFGNNKDKTLTSLIRCILLHQRWVLLRAELLTTINFKQDCLTSFKRLSCTCDYIINVLMSDDKLYAV